MSDIFSVVENEILNRGGIKLLRPEDAIRVILEARLRDVVILGIDAFHIMGIKIQPFIEYSVDYSNKINSYDVDQAYDVYSEAVNFIEARKNLGLHFEIVLKFRQ